MANLTSVGITSGVPSSGTGTVSTIDNLLLQGSPISNGSSSLFVALTGAASSATSSMAGLVVSISPNSVNVNGRALPANSAPVVLNSMTYSAVAASQSSAQFGTTGASGDYLDGILIVPGTAAAGTVFITDGSSSAITIFTGSSVTALPTLAPFYAAIGAVSRNGAGGWKVTTGSNVSVIGIGNFT